MCLSGFNQVSKQLQHSPPVKQEKKKINKRQERTSLSDWRTHQGSRVKWRKGSGREQNTFTLKC